MQFKAGMFDVHEYAASSTECKHYSSVLHSDIQLRIPKSAYPADPISY